MEIGKKKKTPEVADIFRQFGSEYQRQYMLPLQQLKVMSSIEACRTGALGGHVDKCKDCGHERISYNSCRNRHCPKCQFLTKEKWLIKRQNELLPIDYFHIVFTIPDTLNPIALVNKKVMYDILFKAGSETIVQLGRDPKHMGAEIGIIAILHTCPESFRGLGSEYDGPSTPSLYCNRRRIIQRWKDYRDHNKQKDMTVDAFEFIRRFLLHVLPHGFFKIRYYGIFSNRNRHLKLEKCRKIFKLVIDANIKDLSSIDWIQLFAELTGTDLRICPKCKGRMTVRQMPIPASRAPT